MLVLEQIKDAKTGEVIERMVEMPGVMTVEEAAAAYIVQRGEDARTERNARLLACDWTVLTDAPLSELQRAEWATYRQALRDVTAQAWFPDAITWPDTPTSERITAGDGLA